MPDYSPTTKPTSNLWPHIIMYFAKSLGYKPKTGERKEDTVDSHDQATNDQLGPNSLVTEEMSQDEASKGDGTDDHPKIHQLRQKLNSQRKDEEDDELDQM